MNEGRRRSFAASEGLNHLANSTLYWTCGALGIDELPGTRWRSREQRRSAGPHWPYTRRRRIASLGFPGIDSLFAGESTKSNTRAAALSVTRRGGSATCVPCSAWVRSRVGAKAQESHKLTEGCAVSDVSRIGRQRSCRRITARARFAALGVPHGAHATAVAAARVSRCQSFTADPVPWDGDLIRMSSANRSDWRPEAPPIGGVDRRRRSSVAGRPSSRSVAAPGQSHVRSGITLVLDGVPEHRATERRSDIGIGRWAR